MPSTPAKLGFTVLALLLAVLFQPLKRSYDVSGYGRTIQPVTDFTYKCRRIYEPLTTDARPRAAEDMWLSESTRQLFLAASDQQARKQWFPKRAGRKLTLWVAVDIDALDPSRSGADASAYRVLSTPGFDGTAGDGHLSLVGNSGLESDEGFKLYLTNNRPSVDAATGYLLDQAAVGASATVEVFEVGPKAREMRHIRTYAHQHIVTPDNVAPVPGDDEGFYITNDHGQHKVGLVTIQPLPWLGTGDVTYCNPTTCRVASTGHKFPNGLIRSRRDGLIYVPSAWGDGISVHRVLLPSHELERVAHIDIHWSIDNLSEDANGDIYAAAFSKPIEAKRAFDDPQLKTYATAAVLRIRHDGVGGYMWDKILEDRDKVALPGATTVVHDAKTGRLFLSGVISPFITVCEPQEVLA